MEKEKENMLYFWNNVSKLNIWYSTLNNYLRKMKINKDNVVNSLESDLCYSSHICFTLHCRILLLQWYIIISKLILLLDLLLGNHRLIDIWLVNCLWLIWLILLLLWHCWYHWLIICSIHLALHLGPIRLDWLRWVYLLWYHGLTLLLHILCLL